MGLVPTGHSKHAMSNQQSERTTGLEAAPNVHPSRCSADAREPLAKRALYLLSLALFQVVGMER